MTGSARKATVTLPSDTEIKVTREFAAPKDLVYKAWTTPDLIKRWWGAKRGVVNLAEVDLRVGGMALTVEDRPRLRGGVPRSPR